MINIAIVDDEEQDRKYIESKISAQLDDKDFKCKLYTYSTAKQMLEAFENAPYDVVFLDIDMPEIDGMETAERINSMNKNTLIVFVTNHDELVYKAYRFKAIGFIRKGYLDDEIKDLIEVLQKEIGSNTLTLAIKDSHSVINIDLADVLYIQSDDHYVDFHYAERKETIRKTMGEIESLIAEKGFIKTHYRYLVNFRHIHSIDKTTVLLKENVRLPVSRGKGEYVKEKYQMFVRSLR